MECMNRLSRFPANMCLEMGFHSGNREGRIVIRRKSRLVVRGFSQREGMDYVLFYSPVVSFPTLETILAVAA